MADDNGYIDNHLDWLNVQLFESIFEDELNISKSEFSLEIKSIKPAVSTGENYIAEVTRVHVDVTKKFDKKPKSFSFIVKSIGSKEDLDDWGILEKEPLFYSDVVPKLKEIESSEQYLPKSYSTPNELKEKYKTVIVDDLNPHGYKMMNRHEGLDLEHCKLFYKKLGGYHALTVTCYEKYGSFGPRFHKSNYSTDYTMFHSPYVTTMFTSFIEIFTTYDSLKPYHEKVKKWEHEILPQLQALTKPNPDAFNVLCHGDSWTNNILYLHDETNKPKDMIFIDHQLAMFGTPILDILYFWITSPTAKVRNHHFDELVRIYHDSLIDNLTKYNYTKKIPTLRELHMEILKLGSITWYLTMGMMPICCIAANETGPIKVALSDTEEGKKLRYNFYNNQQYLNATESVMKFLDIRGLLEP